MHTLVVLQSPASELTRAALDSAILALEHYPSTDWHSAWAISEGPVNLPAAMAHVPTDPLVWAVVGSLEALATADGALGMQVRPGTPITIGTAPDGAPLVVMAGLRAADAPLYLVRVTR